MIGKLLLFIFLVLIWHGASASTLVKVKPLGSSYKGKYIALEEYGYNAGKSPFTRIRILDVWEDKKLMDMKLDGSSTEDLESIRIKNRSNARKQALKYKIQF